MVIFHSYVSLPEGRMVETSELQFSGGFVKRVISTPSPASSIQATPGVMRTGVAWHQKIAPVDVVQLRTAVDLDVFFQASRKKGAI